MVESTVEIFFTLLTLEFKAVSEEFAETRDFFGRDCKYSIITGSDKCGIRVSLGISNVSHLLSTGRVFFGEGDVVAGRV